MGKIILDDRIFFFFFFGYLECPAIYSFGPSRGHCLLNAKAYYVLSNNLKAVFL